MTGMHTKPDEKTSKTMAGNSQKNQEDDKCRHVSESKRLNENERLTKGVCKEDEPEVLNLVARRYLMPPCLLVGRMMEAILLPQQLVAAKRVARQSMRDVNVGLLSRWLEL